MMNNSTIEINNFNRMMFGITGELAISPKVECGLSGDTFSCVLIENSDVHPTLDASIMFKLDTVGAWTDSTNLAGEITYDISCTGADCATAIQQSGLPMAIPCASTFDYTATKN